MDDAQLLQTANKFDDVLSEYREELDAFEQELQKLVCAYRAKLEEAKVSAIKARLALHGKN